MFTDHGIELVDVYLGSAACSRARRGLLKRPKKRPKPCVRQAGASNGSNATWSTEEKALEAKIAAMRAEFETEKEELERYH